MIYQTLSQCDGLLCEDVTSTYSICRSHPKHPTFSEQIMNTLAHSIFHNTYASTKQRNRHHPAETRRDQHKTSTKQRNRQRPAETSAKPAQNSETGRDQQRPAQNQHKTAKPAETSRYLKPRKTEQRPAETSQNQHKTAQNHTKPNKTQREQREQSLWFLPCFGGTESF